jgi:HlyD family secretion protein
MVARIAVFVVIAAALIGALLYSQQRPAPEKASGFLEVHDIRVGSRVGGRIARVAVTEGQTVAAGDVLLELEPYDLEARLAEAQGKLREQEATLARLTAGFRKEDILQAQSKRDQLKAQYEKARAGPRKQEITEAEAIYQQAQVQREIAAASYERMMKQFEMKNASPEERDRATNDFKATTATLNVRREQLDLLKEGNRKEDIETAAAQLAEAEAALALMRNGSRAEDIAAAQASVESAKGTVAIIGKQLDELKIMAPLSGTVDAVDIRPGDMLAPNAPALSVLEAGELWVRA